MGAIQTVVGFGKTLDLHVFASERLHDANAADALLQAGERSANPFPHSQVRQVRFAVKLHAGQSNERHRHQAQDQQQRIEEDKRDQRGKQQQCCGHEHEQPELHEHLQRVDIRCHP